MIKRDSIQTPLCVAAASLAIGLAVCVCGCNRTGGSGEIGELPTYPDLQQAQTLDVQVFREETRLSFTNTTSRAFGPCRVWLNQWYSREVAGIGVGQTVEYELSSFKDRFGDCFRAGGFFATVPPAKVVLVQIENQNELLGLVIVENR